MQILEPDTTPTPKVVARFCCALQELGMVLQPIVDEEFLGLGQAQESRQVVFPSVSAAWRTGVPCSASDCAASAFVTIATTATVSCVTS